MNWRSYLGMAKQAVQAWVDDRAASMGAALSYYTVFSVAPLLLIVTAVAGLVFGQEAAQGAIVAQISDLVGEASAQAIQGLLQSVAKPKEGVIATVTGVLLLLVGATTVFAELQDDLNRVWNAPRQALPGGLWGWLRARLLSIGLILAIGFLLLVSLAASAAISALGQWWGPMFGAWERLAQAVNFIVSFGIVTALFALIYRFMPQLQIEWRDVWVGAAVTALLFTIGKFLIGLYIGKSAVVSGFGAAGSLAVLLVWVYYSAQIFLLGAEFTWVFAHQYGSRQGVAAEGAAPGSNRPPALAPKMLPQAAAPVAPLPPARASGPGAALAAARRHPATRFLGSAALGAVAVLAMRAARAHIGAAR
ncbi:MAG: YihY/virulence factor BrkB family protein [Pseudomonadota bacterium]